ncbi:MAG TPA: AMP-binding protein [Bryobacteraceae bacterium]|nr:AMP-binding protein [Bryobacteraceae bacterium]
MNRDAIGAAQLDGLHALQRELRAGNAFYGPRMATPFDTLAAFAEQVPFTVKADLAEDQRLHPPFGRNHTYPLDRYTRFCQTSSTTGHPLRWLDTAESWGWMLDRWERVFAAAGVRAGDRVFFAFSFGPFLGFWTAFDAATRMGCLAIPGGGMSSTARLRTLIDSGATVICCTPTYAIRLGEAAQAEGVDLRASAVRTLVVAGEPGGSVPGTRALLQGLWPETRIADHHGMTETGPVTYECPLRTGVLHVMEPAFYAEIVDPQSGAPLEAGQSGELVLTNLGRTASPVVRYRTGDIVQPEAPGQCVCGSWETALAGGILTRRDDMVIVRGVNIYPSAVEDVVRGCGEVAEYRVEVSTVRSMTEIRLVAEAEGETAHRLETALRAAFGLRIPVAVAAAGTLPRFEMKARRWVRVTA